MTKQGRQRKVGQMLGCSTLITSIFFVAFLSGCQPLKQENVPQSSNLQTANDKVNQKTGEIPKNTPTKGDLTNFLLQYSNAYCDLKKIDFIFWQKYDAPKYQQQFIEPGGNDVPLMRWLGSTGLNYVGINNIEKDFDKVTSSQFSYDFSDSIRLLNLTSSYLNQFLTINSKLVGFQQFKDEAMPPLAGFRDAVPRIESELKNDFEEYSKNHADIVAPEDEGMLAIDDICTTLMPELTQTELQGVPYSADSQSLTKIDLDLWEPPVVLFIKVDKQDSYTRSSNGAYYLTGTTSNNCDYIEVSAYNPSSGKSDLNYMLTTYEKGDTTFKYGVKEDFNNLWSGENDYTFKAHCDGDQVVQDSAIMTLTPVTSPVTTQVPLSNNNYYTNAAGNEVHSPAYAPSTPAGATARCKDGTYSFSQSRRGTCSHHGGVAQWL